MAADWASIFLIFGTILLVLLLIQIARVLRARHTDIAPDLSSPMNVVFPSDTLLNPNHTSREANQTTETWLFVITTPLINRITAGQEYELHFIQTCSIQSVKPFPTTRENSYYEIKIIELPSSTTLVIGLAPQDTSHNVLPGKNKNSIGLESNRGQLLTTNLCHEYGDKFNVGDIIGCGFRPLSERVFFTRNGRRYPRVVFEATSSPVFPTIQANGPCVVEFNFGHRAFVLSTANSRNYGLVTPDQLTVPPPSYGHHSMDLSICSSRDSNSFMLSDSLSAHMLSPINSTSSSLLPPPYINSPAQNIYSTSPLG